MCCVCVRSDMNCISFTMRTYMQCKLSAIGIYSQQTLTDLQETPEEPFEDISKLTDLVMVENAENLEHLVDFHFVLLLTLAPALA